MAAWGVVVPPGKTVPFVPPPDGGRLHLSQATLVPPSASASVGRALLFARAGEHGAEVAVASLRGDGKGAECVGLDLIFDEYTEFRVDAGGGAAGAALPCVHLAGYHLPDFGDDGDDDDDEFDSDDDVAVSSDDDEAPLAVPIDGAALSTSDDEDDDDETDASDSDALSESEDDEEAAAAARAAQGVVIEELPPDGDKAAAAEKPPALPAPGDDDDDVESSGSEDDDDDESESGSESESESDDGAATGSDDDADDEPAVPAPEWGGGGKRKPAGEAAGGPPAKKGGAAAPATPAQAVDAKKPAAAAKKQDAAPAAAANKKKDAATAAASKIRRYDNGFIVEELAPGRPAGKRVTPGARVDVRYVGKLAKTGKVFDATKGASTFSFRCGVGEVIKAWDRGVAGAVEGAKLRITAPPAMAYGASGVRGAIPGNATLVFDVEVVRVR